MRATARTYVYPATVSAAVLATIFLTEYALMLALPWLLPTAPRSVEAAVDAVGLTLVLAPIIWLTVVRPLREVNRLRSQFLAELFANIEADRRQTARELHDGVGQSMSLLVSGLRSARESPEQATTRCESLLQLARTALADV